MARPKTKDATSCTFNLDNEVVKQLDNFSKETFIPKTKIVEEAIKNYIKSYNENK